MAISQQEANHLFYEIDGVLYWREREVFNPRSAFNKKYANREAGGLDGKGYRRVKYDQSKPSEAVHRIIFLMYFGFLPEVVDHIDGNKLNNRIENLRAANHQKNNQNSRLASHNTSGFKGVSFHKPSKRWRCTMSFNNKNKQVWGFNTKEDAIEFMHLWREMAHGKFANHG